MIYLMSPYSHESELIREGRYLAAELACVAFFKQGIAVYSPVVHWHNAAKRHHLSYDAAAFREQNMGVLVRCTRAAILTLSGWELSDGIREEVHVARKHHIGDSIGLYQIRGNLISRIGKLDDAQLR